MMDLGAQYSSLYSARLFLMPPSPPSPPYPPLPTSTGRRLEIEARWAALDNRTLYRRMQSYDTVTTTVTPTGAVGGGDDVTCTEQLENGKEYTGTPLSSRTVDEPDAVFCEHDCVRNPICNYWSWYQTGYNTGTCKLFNAVTDYVDASDAETCVSGLCTPTRDPTTFHMPGTLEIWVSRSLALFGTRAAVIDTTRLEDGETTVYLTEGTATDFDYAEGRYIYLRSFDSNRELRIDGIKIFKMPDTGRRLDDELKSSQQEPDANHQQHLADKAEARSWSRIYRMRNLTMSTCHNEISAPILAKERRQMAAMLWADLSAKEALIGCTSCVTHRPVNCTQWFMMPHGYKFAHTEELEKKRRQMREQLDRDEPERKRRLSEALASSCCKTHRKTGKKECGRQFCQQAFKAKANKRMAHVLREMHDQPRMKHVNLRVDQLVSTDMLAPHLHHKKECQTEKARDKHGHLECLAASVVKHLGAKHGFSEDEINKKMSQYGMTVADIMTAQLRHSVGTSSKKKTAYHSDPKKADKAAAMRRAEKARRKLGLEEAKKPVRKGARASWLKRSTRRGRRLTEDDGEPAIGIEALSTSGKELRMRKKYHAEFARNQSMAAKTIMRSANLATATQGTPPVTMTSLMGAAWDASLASDGSLIGRIRSVAGGFAKIGEKVTHMSNVISEASAARPAAPRQRRMRQLTEREEAYFKRVDDMVEAANRGFKVPDHIDAQWGWVSDAADWSYWWDEAHRVGRVLYNRHAWVQEHAENTNTLPVGELPEHHKTGYGFLDINAPPTHFGTWVRSKFAGGRRHESHRRLEVKRSLLELPRAEPPEHVHQRSLIGAFMDAAVNGEDPLDAAWDALHYNQHQHQHLRKLVETSNWLGQETVDTVTSYGGTLAPIVFGPSTGEVPGDVSVEGEAGLDPLRQIGRYVAYDTLLCYMVHPTAL